MTSFRERVKRSIPAPLHAAVSAARNWVRAPPWEEAVLHRYAPAPEPGERARLSLVLPNLEPGMVFGGIQTGLEIFFQLGRRMGAEFRVILENFSSQSDSSVVQKVAQQSGVDIRAIEICFRSAETQPISIRKNDIVVAYNWYIALNLTALVEEQARLFGAPRRPMIYFVQDYEPGFYPFSSTHLFARAAFDLGDRVWGIFNSSQLHDYFRLQGHRFGREYVFEPKLTPALRKYLDLGPAPKAKRILVYGRPGVPRNCYPAALRGLRAWTAGHPEFADWEVVSAGLQHRPEALGSGRQLRSVGKLALEDYAALLRTTAVGLSLMSSPHPSYPPLEMAHFGALTLTNGYTSKNLATAHDNIVTLSDIMPETIGAGLSEACRRFEADPDAGWAARSHMHGYTDGEPYPFLADLAGDIAAALHAADAAAWA